MNQTSTVASRSSTLFLDISVHLSIISVWASEMTFTQTRQSDYFYIAYEAAMSCEEVLGAITVVQQRSTRSKPFIPIDLAPLLLVLERPARAFQRSISFGSRFWLDVLH